MNQTEWTLFPAMEGFDYEEGYEYTLVISRKFNGSNASEKFSYTYIKVIEKIEKELEGV